MYPANKNKGLTPLFAAGCLLVLVLGVFLYLLWGSGTLYAAGAITVEKVSGKESTYRATDNLIPLSGSQTWHYVVIIPSGTCNAAAFSNAADASSYIEGNDLTVSNASGTITICFRSSTPVQVGNPIVTYGGIDVGDNVGPAVTQFRYYTGAGNPNDHPITLNAGDIGDNSSFIIQFGEHVTINENGGNGPRLKLNVGQDRYVYLASDQTQRERLEWYFSYPVQAGDNTADLDVIGFELNGATIADEHGNDFIPSDYASFFNGHIAANQAIVVDTVAPEVNQWSGASSSRPTRNAGNIGETININLEFKEGVEVDYNGGTGPRLKLNVGNNRYAYIEEGTFLRSRQTWQFDMFVTAGDDTADLDVIGFELNGATVTDEAGNSFQAASIVNSPFFNGVYADKYMYVIDTVVPTVSVNPSSNDATRKRSITVRASSTAADIDTSSWKHKNITGLAACNAAALEQFSMAGAQMTLDDEAYNGNKVCFGVKDTAANWAYAASGVITGIDRTPPAISVSPSTADAIHKREITVSASSTASDIDDNSWRYKVIPQATACNTAAVASQTSSGLDALLNSESHNGRKVCFAAKDSVNNWAYAASGVITGIDRTAPTIGVSQVSPDNEVSAMVSDNVDNSPLLQSRIISDNVCGPATSGSFTFYTPGTKLTLAVGSRACFRATDSVNNIGYAASGVGTDTTVLADSTPPTISVNPSAADSSPKRQISVTASSSDGDVAAGSWKHRVITASTACNAAAVASSTTAGASTTLNSESHNNHKVCFAVKDTSDNWAYGASGVITGLDRTAPVITVGDVSNNRVSATVSDNVDSSPAFKSQVIGDSVCSSLTGGTFDAYLSGTELTLAVGSRACFMARDSAGNVAYAPSTAAVYIAPPPNSPPTVNVGDVSRNNRVSATIAGDLTNSPVLEIRLISDSNCGPDTVGTFNPYTPGTTITLSAGSRACFRLTDNGGQEDYAVSAAGRQPSGGSTQRSRNPRPRPPQPAKPQLKVTVIVGEGTIGASDNYDPGQTTMSYRVQTNNSCPGAAAGFKTYQEGTALRPDSNDDYYVCFQSVDKADPTNVAYGLSSRVVVDPDPDPDQTPDPIDPDPSSTPDPGVNIVIEESDPLQQQPLADGAAAGAQTDTDPAPVATPGSSSVDDPGDSQPPVSVSDPASDPIDKPDPGDSPPTITTDSDSKIGELIFVLALIALIGAVLVRVVAPKKRKRS